MWLHWIRVTALIGGVSLASVSMMGCGSTNSTAPKTDNVNATKPSANARVVSQSILGQADQTTSLYEMKPGDAGTLGLRARYNSMSGVGNLGSGGSLGWFQPVPYTARDIHLLPTGGITSRGTIAVGYLGSNVGLETAYASLFSSTGTELSRVTFAADSTGMWLYAVTPVNDTTFIAVGGILHAGVIHPLVVELTLKPPGFLERGKVVTVQDRTGWYSYAVPMPSPADQVSLAVVTVDGTAEGVARVHAPWPALDAVTTDWSNTIVLTTGPGVDVNDLAESGGNLYVVAQVDDNRKGTPSGGGYWSSAWAGSYTGAGVPRWSTTVSLSKQEEIFYCAVVGPDAVYGVGTAASYVHSTEDKASFGYGLISKLDLNDGHVLANFTIGDERFQSGFNTAILAAGQLVCGGWTNSGASGGPYQGWFATVNTSPTVVPAALAESAPATAAPDRRGKRGPSEAARTRGLRGPE